MFHGITCNTTFRLAIKQGISGRLAIFATFSFCVFLVKKSVNIGAMGGDLLEKFKMHLMKSLMTEKYRPGAIFSAWFLVWMVITPGK